MRKLNQLARQFGGIVSTPPLEPGAVLRGNERGQRFAVVVCGYGREAPAPDREATRTLRFDPSPCLCVVRVGNEPFFAGTHLERKRALARFGQELVRLEAVTDLGAETEAVEPAGREDDGVEAALTAFPQPRVDVPAERLDRELGLEREQLRSPSDRGGSDPHTPPKPGGAAERVARILALEVRPDRKPFRVRRGHVLRGMDGDVDPAGEERLLDLLDEHAPRADLAERLRAVLVAGRRDRHERDLDAVTAQTVGRELGLRQREAATATAD